MTEKEVIELIKNARETLGLTQAEFAKLLGVSQGLVSKIETDFSRPRIKTLFQVLDALGLEMIIRRRKL